MNDDNYYINALLSIKGLNTHFAHFKRCDGLWASCKLLYKNRPLGVLPETGDLDSATAAPTCRVRTATAMTRTIPAHLDKTEWLLHSEVLRQMVEQGVEWPPAMRRVRVTVFECVTRDVVETFRAIKVRGNTPETFSIRFAMFKGYDETHAELRKEIFDMFRKPEV
jgi:hypothetical protein